MDERRKRETGTKRKTGSVTKRTVTATQNI
jgi:hypothetical protein